MARLGSRPRPASTAPSRAVRPLRSGQGQPRRWTASPRLPPWSRARSVALASSAPSTCSSGAPRCSWRLGRWATPRPRPLWRPRVA
eukprot:565391-Alexandrium_andersonii.AAC.1